jgi:uncharacterized repeat protein (TIGR03803 family)
MKTRSALYETSAHTSPASTNLAALATSRASRGMSAQIRSCLTNGLVAGGLAATAALLPVQPAQAGEFPIYTFCSQTNCTDGEYPTGVFDVGGNIYGMTTNGGANYAGVLFSMTATNCANCSSQNWVTPLGGANTGIGVYPQAQSADVVSGVFYGTSFWGGNTANCSPTGCGTAVGWNTSNSSAWTYDFTGGPDGAYPAAGLVNVGARFYGTTTGGANGYGTVFALNGNGTLYCSYAFQGGPADGAAPYAGLVKVGSRLYGTTSGGGASGDGTVFSIGHNCTGEQVLHSFSSFPDGAEPLAGLTYDGGNGLLYGTTYYGGASANGCPYGCGTVFSINPNTGVETTVYTLTNTPDGAFPRSGLTYDSSNGLLYGTTFYGGANGVGTVFSLTTAGVETLVYSFLNNGVDGQRPTSNVIIRGSRMFGATPYGGPSGAGTVFEIHPF